MDGPRGVRTESADVDRAPERARVDALLRRHGFVSTAFQTLKAGCSFHFEGDDACVAYVDTGAAWVAAGPPLADPSRLGAVAMGFVAAARARGRRACFFGVEERLVRAAGMGLRSLAIGDEPSWDPADWTAILSRHRSLREQLRRARAKGVTVRVVGDSEQLAGPLPAAVERVTERWLATRGMAPMAFLVIPAPLALVGDHVFFAAERSGELVGFSVVLPVPARGGWFIETLVRDPDAPNGAAEALVDAVMRWADTAGASWVTLGLAPLGGEIAAPLRWARRSAKLLYDFEGIRAYKAKLRPTTWTPILLAYPASESAMVAVVDALSAFTGDGFIRFGWRSFLRGPRAVMSSLAVLLVPWTVTIALAPTDRWFSAAWVKWSWVAFDLALAVALFRVLRRPEPSWVTALAVAVTADTVVTTLEALSWNLAGAPAPLDYVVAIIACVGPAAAAVTLWGARKRAMVLVRRD